MNIPGISPQRLDSMMRSRWLLPGALLDELGRHPDFGAALRAPVGVQVSFTLRTHTLRVLDCYEKHFAQRPGVSRRERGLFRLFLALHDIGKPLAIEAGDKRWQHRFTIDLLRQTRASYPISDREFADWIALVDGDPLGAFLKGEIEAAPAADTIRKMAARSSCAPGDYFKQLVMYYQCDVSSYTRRAGLMKTLDGLFEWEGQTDEIAWDEEAGLLKFSEAVKKRMAGFGPAQIWGTA